jgi:hypothetical protein
MRFLRRHQFLLCFLAVLVFSSIMVVRQFLANQSKHAEMREDFILLNERGDKESAEWLYERLIQQFPDLNEASLVQDLMRTSPLVTPLMAEEMDSLLWKYNVSVKNELKHRSESRVGRALERVGKQ